MSETKPPPATAPVESSAKAAEPIAPHVSSAAEVAVVAAGNVHAQAKASRLKKTGGTIREVFQGVRSEDVPTRNASILFVLSLVGIVFVMVLAGQYFLQTRKEAKIRKAEIAEAGKNPDEEAKKQQEEGKKKFVIQSLGTFNIELKPVDPEVKVKGVLNMAEVEVQAQCDTKETCEFLEGQQAKVKDEVSQVFTAVERDELLSKEGKRKMKKKIVDRLNLFLTEGKVDDIFFSKLILN